MIISQHTLIILGIVLCATAFVLFTVYAKHTNKLIKEKDKEIARLQTQLNREKRKRWF